MASGFWKPASSSEQLREGVDDESVLRASFSKLHTPLAQQRLLLPIYKHRVQIQYAVEEFDIVVIVGETGCGKSTQLPQYLVASGWAGNDFCILCTQPRRIAATTLAERVAQEQNTRVGERVGYSVRFDHQCGPHTQIKYATDGMLLREATLADPLLSNYSVVIVDEAHERSLNSDAVLGLLKKIRKKRKHLRIIICSATIDAQSFLDFFVGVKPGGEGHDGEDAKASSSETKGTIISVDGRQYPVDVFYIKQPAPDYVRAVVETAASILRHDKHGDVLCFLSSGEDIDHSIKLAEETLHGSKVDLLPLYGNLPYHMQARVFQRGDPKKSNRRIIFATNIAETSVTVPNVSHVVDSGLVKLPYFDPKTGLERLIVAPISQASARQRAGRAGRVSGGKCYRLYTEQYFVGPMKSQTTPEILRSNLTSFILTLKSLGVDNILAFDLMDVPSVDALSHGLETLYALGAIDDNVQLTDLGLDMSSFPTEPRVSRMLLESLSAGCSWEVLAVASALQVRDLFTRPRGKRAQQNIDYEAAMAMVVDPSGDHVTFANLLTEMDDRHLKEQECRDRFINYLALKRAMEVRQQLSNFLRKFGRVQALGVVGDDGQARSRAIRRCVTAGFFFNVAKLASDGRYYTLRKQILVTPSSSSVLSLGTTIASEYIVFGETLDGSRGGIEVKAVSSIEARWLRELAPHYWE